jgi:hypothetical protein
MGLKNAGTTVLCFKGLFPVEKIARKMHFQLGIV